MSKVFHTIQDVVKKNNPDAEMDVFIVEGNHTSIDVKEQEIENFDISKKTSVSLRILDKGRIGSAYSSDISVGGLKDMVRRALSNIEYATKDEYNVLPEINNTKIKKVKSNGIYDKNLQKISAEDKIDKLKEMEKNVRAYDQRIKKIFRSSYSDGDCRIIIVNSLGMAESYQSTYCSIGISAVASQGQEIQVGSQGDMKRCFNDLNFIGVPQQAAEKAISLLGAKQVNSQTTDVILPPEIACEFLDVISDALCADSVQKGKSIFKDKIGKKIGSSLITIVDDGTLLGGIATVPFDDEGVCSQRKTLVDKGVLEGFLYDTYTARKDNTQSTGNASRDLFAGLSAPAPSNFFIENQNIKREDLIKNVGNGLYVIDVMGMHMVDTVSGDFSLGVEGLWISDGMFSFPVRGITMAGNILNLLGSIQEVGNDLTFYGDFGSPSLKISQVSIGGK